MIGIEKKIPLDVEVALPHKLLTLYKLLAEWRRPMYIALYLDPSNCDSLANYSEFLIV